MTKTSAATAAKSETISPEGDNSELEFDASNFDAVKVAATIKKRGCALVRGMTEKRGIEHIRLRALRTYAEKEEQRFLGQMPDDYYAGIYRFGHIRFTDMTMPGEQPMNFLQYIFTPMHLEVLANYYEHDDYSFLMRNTILRKQAAGLDSQRVPFHQDGSFLEPGMPVLNSWIPLSPCGVDAPGMELVTVGLTELIELDPYDIRTYGDVYKNININDKTIEKNFNKSCLWRPVMDAGDVLFLTSYTIHRTNYNDSMKKERISVEARSAKTSLITPSASAAGLASINLKKPG